MRAVLALSMIGLALGDDTAVVESSYPEAMKKKEPPPPPPPPKPAVSVDLRELWLRQNGPPEGTPPCPVHDADGRRCALGLQHLRAPWLPHSHPDGWSDPPESRQVRRARERATAKSLRRSRR
jgi:hypothetical protein